MIAKKIKKCIKGVYPFHMPGHKRNPKFLRNYAPLDVTETEDTDNLLAPRGVIKYAEERTSKIFRTNRTFYVTGGSTCAIHAAIRAVTKADDRIIMARNCHKSVWSAAELLRLKTDYIYPKINSVLGVFGEINPQELEEQLSSSPTAAVVITSPTYEGIISDISAIADIVHKNNSLLIVDSAHGAHLGFCDCLPESARSLGADIVIESAHKTLPCMTGAAMLHICSDRIEPALIAEALCTFASSSPPYPIIYSLDDMTELIMNKGERLFSSFCRRLNAFYKKCATLKHISLYDGSGSFDFDKTKLCLVTGNTDINGFMLKGLLREYGISCEMAQADFCLAMTSIADTDKGFNKLFSALEKIDKRLSYEQNNQIFEQIAPLRKFSLFEARDMSSVYIMSERAAGKTSAEYIFAYPPGSPIIAPGEIITSETLDLLENFARYGADIYSSGGKYPEYIKILQI